MIKKINQFHEYNEYNSYNDLMDLKDPIIDSESENNAICTNCGKPVDPEFSTKTPHGIFCENCEDDAMDEMAAELVMQQGDSNRPQDLSQNIEELMNDSDWYDVTSLSVEFERLYKDWWNRLTQSERTAINEYVENAYTSINSYLRYGDISSTRETNPDNKSMAIYYADQLKKALEASVCPKNTIVYRGTSSRTANEMFENIEVGGHFIDKGFISTTLSKSFIDIFIRDGFGLNKCILEIMIPAGTNGAGYLLRDKNINEEYEILLQAGSALRIVNKHEHKDPTTGRNVRLIQCVYEGPAEQQKTAMNKFASGKQFTERNRFIHEEFEYIPPMKTAMKIAQQHQMFDLGPTYEIQDPEDYDKKGNPLYKCKECGTLDREVYFRTGKFTSEVYNPIIPSGEEIKQFYNKLLQALETLSSYEPRTKDISTKYVYPQKENLFNLKENDLPDLNSKETHTEDEFNDQGQSNMFGPTPADVKTFLLSDPIFTKVFTALSKYKISPRIGGFPLLVIVDNMMDIPPVLYTIEKPKFRAMAKYLSELFESIVLGTERNFANHSQQASYIRTRYDAYCSGCVIKEYGKCDSCGDPLVLKSTEKINGIDVIRYMFTRATTNDQNICKTCYDNYYTVCSKCNLSEVKEKVTFIEGLSAYVCSSCREEAVLCSICGNETLSPHEVDGEIYCDKCNILAMKEYETYGTRIKFPEKYEAVLVNDPVDMLPINSTSVTEDAASALQGIMKEWGESLTRKEVAALRDYTGNNYRIYNRHLRYGKDLNTKEENLIDHLKLAIKKAKIPKDVIAYRGTSSKYVMEMFENCEVGDVVQDPGIQSLSLNFYTSSDFSEYGEGGGEVFIQYLIPAGTKGAAYVAGIAKNKSEQEILIYPNTKMRVRGKGSDLNRYKKRNYMLVEIETEEDNIEKNQKESKKQIYSLMKTSMSEYNYFKITPSSKTRKFKPRWSSELPRGWKLKGTQKTAKFLGDISHKCVLPVKNRMRGETPEAWIDRLINDHRAYLQCLNQSYGFRPRAQYISTSGLPGSGKSFIVEGRYRNYPWVFVIDSDFIKEHLDGYNPRNPGEVHDESKRLEGRMFQQAIQNRFPVLYVTTAINHEKMKERIEDAKNLGYKTKIEHVEVDPQIARQRNRKRDRFVADPILDEMISDADRSNPRNQGKTPFEILKPNVNKVRVTDNNPENQKNKPNFKNWYSLTAV